MARIIPWTLPPVKGGSIGGYTERDSGSGGDSPVITQYYNFENAVFRSQVNTQTPVSGRAFIYTKANTTAIYNAFNYVYSGNNLPYKGWFENIEVVELVGVSAVSFVINGTASNATIGDVVVKGSYDIETAACTFVSGTTTGSLTYDQTLDVTIDSITFTVYNGAGEVLQQTEVTYS